MKRNVKGKYVLLPVVYLSLFHPTFSEKQTWAKYRTAQLLLQYYKAKVS